MFKKSERLNRVEFSSLFKTGKRCHNKVCTVIYQPADKTKVAVVVSKKVAKSAVRRNTIKRRVYAVLRLVLEEKIYQGEIIVIVKPGLNTLSRRSANTNTKQAIADCLQNT